MPLTYNDLYLDLRQILRREGAAQPGLEAREIITHVTGKSREEFQRDTQVYVSPPTEEKIRAFLERRLLGEPLAYILGEWEFMGLPFDVTPDVLIPRPDTESLVNEALGFLQSREEPRVLDLCTGCGCIGISIAKLCAGSRVILGDISSAALAVARRNIRRHDLGTEAACVAIDALRPASISLGHFDAIVANPPYIRTGDLASLPPSVRAYEPRMALDGGEDGLDFYRAIAAGFRPLFKQGGGVFFEVGFDEAADVRDILDRNGYHDITIAKDLTGTDRVVKALVG